MNFSDICPFTKIEEATIEIGIQNSHINNLFRKHSEFYKSNLYENYQIPYLIINKGLKDIKTQNLKLAKEASKFQLNN